MIVAVLMINPLNQFVLQQAALAALNGDPADAASVLIRGWIHSTDPLAGTAAKGSGPG